MSHHRDKLSKSLVAELTPARESLPRAVFVAWAIALGLVALPGGGRTAAGDEPVETASVSPFAGTYLFYPGPGVDGLGELHISAEGTIWGSMHLFAAFGDPVGYDTRYREWYAEIQGQVTDGGIWTDVTTLNYREGWYEGFYDPLLGWYPHITITTDYQANVVWTEAGQAGLDDSGNLIVASTRNIDSVEEWGEAVLGWGDLATTGFFSQSWLRWPALPDDDDSSGGGEGTDDPPLPPPTLSIADASVLEGNKGTSTLNLMVTLSRESDDVVTVNYQTFDGTATAEGKGKDYSANSGTLTFSSGQTSGTISISIKGDREREPDETFTVQLSNAVGATIGDGIATATILNDD